MELNKKKTLPLALGALGVVFGDIGTSPLYSVNEIYEKTHALPESKTAIIGGISLIIWSLTLIVTIKYIIFVLRADDDGEGGVFALYSLLRRHKARSSIIVMGLLVLAAGMLFGDGVITPAISVLASIEGIEVVSSSFQRFVIPVTIIILALLFAFQSKGTHKVGKLFGPITLVWFFSIASIGIYSTIKYPEILRAIDPLNIAHAFDAITLKHFLLLLGSVMLVVTGGEALYADLGHFGKNQSAFHGSVLFFQH
ncbi:MAG: KUP/HAK/KT family potassium transporter [Acidimicrobiia bacterium]